MTRTQKLTVSIILIVTSVLLRTVLHLGPNVEFVTTATIMSGLYLGYPFIFIVPLVSLIISDAYLGNTSIFLFTWSAYIFIALFVLLVSRIIKKGNAKFFKTTLLSFFSVSFFYLWTNFGVWILDQWGMYPKTVSGLIQAYIMGLPFLKYQLFGNIIFIPVTYILLDLYVRFSDKKDLNKLSNKIKIQT